MISSPDSPALCEECETFPRFYRCETCQQDLCISCDLRVHDKAKRKLHDRGQLSVTLDKTPDPPTPEAMVFCLSIENLESKEAILGGIRRKTDEYPIETLFLLVWNENNEKINKLLLEIQLNLTKQKVIVCFMRSNHDLEDFFRGFKREEEKFRRVRILLPQKLAEEVKRASFKASTASKKCEFSVYEDELFLASKELDKTIVKKPQNDLQDTPQTIMKRTHSDLQETPQKYCFSRSFASNNNNAAIIDCGFPELQPYKPTIASLPGKVAIFIQNFFRFYARAGVLMLEKGKFLPLLTSGLLSSALCAKEDLPYIVLEAEKQKLFHTTIRRFGNETETFGYISLHLESLSVESLFWVLKSLQLDEMTPTEKLIQSRVKESFCLKLSLETWRSYVGFLIQNPEKSIGIRLERDSENEENYCLFLAWEKWVCSDKGKLTSELDQSNWDEFLDFLRSFFFSAAVAKISYKSVENMLEREEGRKKYAYFNKKFLKAFIPGGKYGCCQYIKCCGTPTLRTLSFGKLSLFVQEALDRGVLEYYKTLLIATEKLKLMKIQLSEAVKEQEEERKQSFMEKTAEKPKGLAQEKIKEVLLRILGGFAQGVNLSRLPKILHFYLNVPFDCQEFGFKKLKDFLATFPEIELLEYGDNIVARLRGNPGGGPQSLLWGDPYNIYKSSGFK